MERLKAAISVVVMLTFAAVIVAAGIRALFWLLPPL